MAESSGLPGRRGLYGLSAGFLRFPGGTRCGHGPDFVFVYYGFFFVYPKLSSSPTCGAWGDRKRVHDRHLVMYRAGCSSQAAARPPQQGRDPSAYLHESSLM